MYMSLLVYVCVCGKEGGPQLQQYTDKTECCICVYTHSLIADLDMEP